MERSFLIVCFFVCFVFWSRASELDDRSHVRISGKMFTLSKEEITKLKENNSITHFKENILKSSKTELKFNLTTVFSNLIGKSAENTRISLRFLYSCGHLNTTIKELVNDSNSSKFKEFSFVNSTEDTFSDIRNTFTHGSIALDTKCNDSEEYVLNFSLLNDMENKILKHSNDNFTCYKDYIIQMNLDIYKLFQRRGTCLDKDSVVNFILELQNENDRPALSTLHEAVLLLDAKDASCDFDNGCQWEFDRTALVPSTASKWNCSACRKVNNLQIQSWLKNNHCRDCRKFPMTTAQGKLHGWFLPNDDVNATKMTTHHLLGSSSGCTLELSLWLFQGDFVVNIRTDTVSKQLYKMSRLYYNSWQRLQVFIGKIDTAFMLEIMMSLPLYENLAIDDIKLVGCNNTQEEDIQECTEDEFRCSTASCIPKTRLCDLVPDCLFGDDETNIVCDVIPNTARCSFENGWCGWSTSPEDSNASKCMFQRTNFSDVITTAYDFDKSYDRVLYLNAKDCGNKGYAVLYSPMFEPITPVNDTCQLRFSSYSEKKNGRPSFYVKLCEEKEEECDVYTYDDIISETYSWIRYSFVIDRPSTKKFYIEIEADYTYTGLFQHDTILDKLSLSPECFSPDNYEQNVTFSMPRDLDVERKKEKSVIILALLGAIAGTVMILVAALVIVTVYRRKTKAEQIQKPYRKISSHSSSTTSTTTSSLEDKIGFPDEALLDNESSEHHSDRQVSLNGSVCHSERQLSINGSLCAMTISPYYEWIQEDEMIRNIPRTKIKLLRMIGKGAFGEVYYGLLADVAHLRKDLPVAIKTLPSLCSEQTKSEFFFEALILSKFKHPNIVRFLGISVDDRSMFLILELMEGGDVRSFVRDARPREKDEPSSLTIQDLLKLSIDIAKGCQYLECNKFIHRDIAARNCLLTEKGPNRVAKIGDFGMARDILGTNYYRKNGIAMIPVKWMPTEAFMDGVFTSKTDVWAFGVVMWEIFTMGFVPYPGITNNDVMKYVMSGGRLSQPPLASTEVFMLMRDCWKTDPKERPVFSTIVESLNAMLKELKNDDKICLSDINREVPAPPEPMEKHESIHSHTKNSSHKSKRDHKLQSHHLHI